MDYPPRRFPGNRMITGKTYCPKRKGENLFILFLNQFNQALVYILLAAALGVGLLHEN